MSPIREAQDELGCYLPAETSRAPYLKWHHPRPLIPFSLRQSAFFLTSLVSKVSQPHEGGDVALWPLPSPTAFTVFVTD